ncbi:MAG: patatin-like phospholipase family protein [Spirochaetaceae bacterium]|nr:MAG: patatin-like phospholipase family protein [Spirochaetaceae bacterium]
MKGKSKSRKIGLALGGGAARGLAHIGVLKVLEEEGIVIHRVAGTSAGSLIGSLFCAGLGWQKIAEVARNIDWGNLVSPTWPSLGLVSPDKLEKTLNDILRRKRFEELAVPFRAVAVDIASGEEVVLNSGAVARAVRASCSIPGIFEPTEFEGRLLVDGGLVNDVPTDVVKDMGAELVIGVDLNADRVINRRPENLIEIFYRSLNILIYNSTQRARRVADVMVVPELQGFAYHDLSRLDELIARGTKAMRAQINKVKKLTR